MYDELPALRMHSTLVQAFDTARFHDRKQDETPQVSIARSEVFLNLVFGRTVVLPAGHIADSPAVVRVVREALAGYERASRRRPQEQPQWLFRVALEPNFGNYSDYIQKYVHGDAPTVLLNPAEGSDARSFAYVAQLYLDGKFDELEKTLSRNGYSDYARLIHDHVDTAVTRPRGQAVLPDFVHYLERQLGRLDAGPGAELAREIRAGMPASSEADTFRSLRGRWYRHQDRFPTSWPLVRMLLDEALYVRLSDYYGVEHPAFVTQEIEAALDQLLRPEAAAPDGTVMQLPDHGFEPVAIDWQTVGELLADEKFGRSARTLTKTIERADTRDEISDAIATHAEYVQQYFTDISFDMQAGRVVVQRRDAVVGPYLAGFGVGALTEILLGTFLPAVAAAQPPGLLTGVAGLLAGQFATRESKAFRRQPIERLSENNAAATASARSYVSRCTKPVRRNTALVGAGTA